MDWGAKMVLLKQMEPIDLLNYVGLLSFVSEEYGGNKTAYWYDYLTRQALSRDALRGVDEAATELGKLNRDRVRDAKMRAEQPGPGTKGKRQRQDDQGQPQKRGRQDGGGGRQDGGGGRGTENQKDNQDRGRNDGKDGGRRGRPQRGRWGGDGKGQGGGQGHPRR